MTTATDINDLGQIVGTSYDSGAESTIGFLLTPIPEPSTYAAICGALVLGLAILRRRRSAV